MPSTFSTARPISVVSAASRGNDFHLVRQGRLQRAVRVGRRHDDLDVLRAIDDVRVRQDVAVRIDDEAGSDLPLPGHHGADLAPAVIVSRPVRGHQDLDHAGPHLFLVRVDRLVHAFGF
jgi:hypothetical protein